MKSRMPERTVSGDPSTELTLFVSISGAIAVGLLVTLSNRGVS
jgi:hypothetical protein